MYYPLAITLALALLLVTNFLATLMASCIWRTAVPLVREWSSRRRAQAIFGLRILPVAGTLIFVAAFLLPAYFLFEPHETEEEISARLALLAVISIVGVSTAFWRVLKTLWVTRKLLKSWLDRAERITLPGVSIPVYAFDHAFPVFAVVGAFRPRMFVARHVLAALDGDELQAAIAHESGHLSARDNIKRILLRVCRDLLLLPCGQKLDRAWAENVEAAADEHAARLYGRQTALSLASALIKIAKLVPASGKTRASLAASSVFLIDTHSCDVTFRVKRLLAIAENSEFYAVASIKGSRLPIWIPATIVFILIAFLSTNLSFLQQIHVYYELLVAFV